MEPFNHRLNTYIESWMGPRGKVLHPYPSVAGHVRPTSLPPELPVIVCKKYHPPQSLSSKTATQSMAAG